MHAATPSLTGRVGAALCRELRGAMRFVRGERPWFYGFVFRASRVLWGVVLLAIALSLPSLFADFYADDQGMVLTLEGVARPPIPGPFRLYTFASGAPGERDALVTGSRLPWWTVDRIRISFFRPLSSALLALDHALAGRRPLLYHVHSIASYATAALSAALLFRRLLPEREAALSALLFTVSPAHWMLAAWPSARHVAISGTFAILALLLQLEARARADRDQPAWSVSVAALGCAVLALAGGETALGLFGFVFAHEWFGRSDRLALRGRVLAPWFVLFVVYALAYRGLGFGVRGAGAYVDPAANPLEYLSVLPSRFAVYLNAALLCVPSELSMLAPRAVPVLAAAGVLAFVGCAALFGRAQLALAPVHRRTLTWLLVGAGLALLPGVASIPGDRVLFLPNLAVAPVLATVLLHASSGISRRGLRLVSRAAVAFVGLVHVLLAPALFLFGAANLASTSHQAIAAASRAEIPVAAGVSVAGIGLSDPLLSMYLPSALYLAPRAEPRPRDVYLLSMSAHDQSVSRIDNQTLEIAVLHGALLDDTFEYLVRPPSAPLRAGDVLPLGAWTVRILEEKSGRPTRFLVHFDRSVDDPSIAFLIWRDGALRRLTPPPLGQEVHVHHERGPMGI